MKEIYLKTFIDLLKPADGKLKFVQDNRKFFQGIPTAAVFYAAYGSAMGRRTTKRTEGNEVSVKPLKYFIRVILEQYFCLYRSLRDLI